MDVVSSSYDATARVPPPAAAPRAAPMALRSSRAYGTYAPRARRPRTPPLPDVLLEELDRALAGLVRARLVERAALVAREAVARRVHVLLEVRVVLLDLLPVLLGDGRVGLAPVEDHRTLRLLRRRVADAAAVVRDGLVAVLLKAVGDVIDGLIHAEDLLDHDQRAPRLSGRRGLVGGELVSVFGGQVDHLSH